MSSPTTVFQNKDTKLEIEQLGDCLVCRPIGHINEASGIGKLSEVVKTIQDDANIKGIAFDLSKVTRFNSIGVFDWLVFVQQVEATGLPYVAMILNEVFIDQLNIVSNMLGKKMPPIGTIEIPYFCPGCSTSLKVLRKVPDLLIGGRRYQAPSLACGKCHEPMSFDGLETEYFGFLNKIN